MEPNKKLQLFYPVKPWLWSQKFGENKLDFYKKLGMLGHNGIDIPCPDGTLVYAAHDGVVTFTGEDDSAGLGVVIRTDREYFYNGGLSFFKTIYWHLKVLSFLVKPGEYVTAGTPIARANSTGRSTGSHLHFGLKPVMKGEADWEWINAVQDNGYKGAIDPAPYFNGIYAENVKTLISSLKLMVDVLTKLLSIYKK